MLAVLAALAPCASACRAQAGPPLTITFLDVGQADAVLIRSPEGRTALIDAGEGSIVGLLESHDVDTIDVAIASHAHADHIGGMAEVLWRYPVRYYLDNGVPHTTVTYGNLLRTLEQSDVTYLRATGRSIALGSVTLRVLPPPHLAAGGGGIALEHNNQSVGVLVEYGEFRALFTGDSEAEELQYFMTLGVPRVTVLKAAHHGSRDAVTPAWLSATRPAVVVISCGRDNTYGHPDPWALRYYESVARQVYRTDLDGQVTIVAGDDGTYEVTTARRREQ
ncbi:MAG TPA: MBL fold metallo-hydrolase [Gemmatimonadales bacterium]|jgi:beta-lactamase superfamily II metal-dependent hydrolase